MLRGSSGTWFIRIAFHAKLASMCFPSRVLRTAALCAGLLMPAAGSAAEDGSGVEPPARAPVPAHWYDVLLHNTDVGIDLLVVRPLSAVTLGAGAALFVPAVIMTAPNGRDSIHDAYQRFVGEPSDYFLNRPLGEF